MRVIKRADFYTEAILQGVQAAHESIKRKIAEGVSVEPLEDYPEPPEAKWPCVYCGKKTNDEPAFIDDEENNETFVFKTHCARSACLDAFVVDPDYRTNYPFGHRPS